MRNKHISLNWEFSWYYGQRHPKWMESCCGSSREVRNNFSNLKEISTQWSLEWGATYNPFHSNKSTTVSISMQTLQVWKTSRCLQNAPDGLLISSKVIVPDRNNKAKSLPCELNYGSNGTLSEWAQLGKDCFSRVKGTLHKQIFANIVPITACSASIIQYRVINWHNT